MTFLFVFLAALVSPAAHADAFTCQLTTEGNILEEKQLTVTLDEKEISFDADFFGKTEKVSGKFLRKAKNGSLMYDGSDLMAQIDQSDYGYIFVDPSLLQAGQGKIGFSVRQLGDSEGWSWISDSYRCQKN